MPASPLRYDPAHTRLVFWLCIAAALGVTAIWSVAEHNGIRTAWDTWGLPPLALVIAGSAAIIHRHPEQTHAATLTSLVAGSFFCLGAVCWDVTQNEPVAWVAMASMSQYMGLLYVAAFVALQRGATTFSCWHYALLVVLYLLLMANPWQQRAPDPKAFHLWTSILTSNPAYILALHYITTLRGRLTRKELEHHQSKERFLAMLSHEIRSPLQAMLGSIDLLALKVRPGPERRAVDRLRDAAGQLDAHLRDVTEFTRLENPAWQLRDEPVNLCALGQDLVEQLMPQAVARGLALRLEVHDADGKPLRDPLPPLPWAHVRSDRRRLRQVLANLLTNALKYTPAGHVTLRLLAPAAPEAGPVIEIEDTGIGIPADEQERVFEPYVRLEDQRVAHEEGSGLGLAVVHLLTQRLGLSLRVDSQPDVGTTFHLDWPSPSA